MSAIEWVGTARVRGLVPAAHLKWVDDYFGGRVLERVLATLPQTVAEDVSRAGAASWCALESVLLLDAAIAEVCGRDAATTYRELGRYTAHTALSQRDLTLIRTDLHRFLRCSAVRDALFQNRGGCSYRQTGPREGTLTAGGEHSSARVYCDVMAGWLEQVVSFHGGDGMTARETRCRAAGDEVCAFELQW